MTRTVNVAAMIAGLAMAAGIGTMAAAGPVALRQGEADMMDFTLPAEPSGDLTAENKGRWGTSCKSPRGPVWSRTPNREEAPRARIMGELYDLRRYTAVLAVKDCPCSLFVPSYDVAEAEMNELVKGLTGDQLYALQRNISQQASAVRIPASRMCLASKKPS